jgi:hypothetical protein
MLADSRVRRRELCHAQASMHAPDSGVTVAGILRCDLPFPHTNNVRHKFTQKIDDRVLTVYWKVEG